MSVAVFGEVSIVIESRFGTEGLRDLDLFEQAGIRVRSRGPRASVGLTPTFSFSSQHILIPRERCQALSSGSKARKKRRELVTARRGSPAGLDPTAGEERSQPPEVLPTKCQALARVTQESPLQCKLQSIAAKLRDTQLFGIEELSKAQQTQDEPLSGVSRFYPRASRARQADEGGLSAAEVRRRLQGDSSRKSR